MDASWAADQRARLEPIRAWSAEELAKNAQACDVLLYPFAGPDVLNPYEFFPRCRTYVLFGLEHLGTVPRLESLPPPRVDELVAQIDETLSDLFTRNYFITERMTSDLTEHGINGTMPIVLLLLARLGAHVVSVERGQLAADGSIRLVDPLRGETGAAAASTGDRERPSGTARDRSPETHAVPAWRIGFVGPGATAAQHVIYFRAQAQNSGLARAPVVGAYLRHLGPTATFLKSASYLLHDAQFSTMRSIVLDASALILQDDSGVPYRFLAPPEWRVVLYGSYARPIKDFKYGFQPDLEAAYAAAATSPLPFSFGYHWRDGRWGVMLARRQVRAAGAGVVPPAGADR